jgi:hypothetical protein
MRRLLVVVASLCGFALGASNVEAQLAPAQFWRMRRSADSLAAIDPSRADTLYRRLAMADTADIQLWLGLATASLALHHVAAAESAFIHVYVGHYFQGQVAVQIARLEADRGRKSLALDWLDSALAHRFPLRAAFQRDSAFSRFHEDPRFRALAGFPPTGNFSRDERWRYDVAFFAAEARRLHVGFERPANAKEFTAAVADLTRRIPALPNDQILAGLQRLATLLHDGHSGLYIRNLPSSHRRLPVDFYWFDDGMYVVGARDDHRDLVGSRVARIGKLTPVQLAEALAPYVPRDNPMRIAALGIPFQLDYPFQLLALGAIEDTARVPLMVEDAGGRVWSATLTADDARMPQARLAPRDTGAANPLWLRNTRANIWLAPLLSEHALYVQYNSCADAPGQTIAAFAHTLRLQLRDTTIHDLIVDVRRNGGGNSLLNAPLHLAVFEFAQASSAHRIWILAGRHTFSAAQNFVNYIERFTNAIFVGEPTGSSPNFTGESSEVVLPFSGLVAGISNENHWSAFWEDQRPWIAPTIPVAFNAKDYFSNRDPVLEAVREIIRQRE